MEGLPYSSKEIFPVRSPNLLTCRKRMMRKEKTLSLSPAHKREYLNQNSDLLAPSIHFQLGLMVSVDHSLLL